MVTKATSSDNSAYINQVKNILESEYNSRAFELDSAKKHADFTNQQNLNAVNAAEAKMTAASAELSKVEDIIATENRIKELNAEINSSKSLDTAAYYNASSSSDPNMTMNSFTSKSRISKLEKEQAELRTTLDKQLKEAGMTPNDLRNLKVDYENAVEDFNDAVDKQHADLIERRESS